MTQDELSRVVDQAMNNWKVESCVACDLRGGQMEERHRPEGPRIKAEWRDHVGFRRWTLSVEPMPLKVVAQVDLHDHGTSCTSVFLPCQLNVSPEDGLLCLSL